MFILHVFRGTISHVDSYFLVLKSHNLSDWWYTYPSEKYESQLGWLFPIYGKIKNVPNHQPVMVSSGGFHSHGCTPSNHPLYFRIFHEINHPAVGAWLWKPPWLSHPMASTPSSPGTCQEVHKQLGAHWVPRKVRFLPPEAAKGECG